MLGNVRWFASFCVIISGLILDGRDLLRLLLAINSFCDGALGELTQDPEKIHGGLRGENASASSTMQAGNRKESGELLECSSWIVVQVSIGALVIAGRSLGF